MVPRVLARRVRLVGRGRRAGRGGLRRRAAPTRSGTRPGPSGGFARRTSRRLGLGHLTPIDGVGARPSPAPAFGRATERSAGQGHDHRALGDDGHPARRAVPLVPRRVPAGDRRAVRAGDRPARSWATFPPPARRSSRSWGRSTSARAGRSCTRAETPSSRSPCHKRRRSAPDALRVVPRRAAAPDGPARGRAG